MEGLDGQKGVETADVSQTGDVKRRLTEAEYATFLDEARIANRYLAIEVLGLNVAYPIKKGGNAANPPDDADKSCA